ncbi:MAG: hypothetical protein ACKV0T_24685, partial [Planctomycetales bacterium]
MDMFVVHGGRRLRGRVRVSGAKNAALPIMAAALLADGPTVLHGVPDLVDVTTLAQLLTSLGMQVRREPHMELIADPDPESPDAETQVEESLEGESFTDTNGVEGDGRPVPFPFGVDADLAEEDGDAFPQPAPLRLEVMNDNPCVADYDLVRKMRASICVLGPLLARRGRACVSLPGG